MDQKKKLSAELKNKCIATTDRFLEDIRKTCHAMIEGDHILDSPATLVKTAIEYLEAHYTENKKELAMDHVVVPSDEHL